MSFLNDVKIGGGGAKVPLPIGTYDDLEIVHYIGAKPTTKDPDLVRHSFLVASDGTEGTAFLAIPTKASWQTPAVLALAFNATDKAVESGDVTTAELAEAVSALKVTAHAKVIDANTPEDQVEAATEKQYENTLTQIRIAVGQLFRLQDWAGKERSATNFALVGTHFKGNVSAGLTGTTTEVSSISKPPKTAPANQPAQAVTV